MSELLTAAIDAHEELKAANNHFSRNRFFDGRICLQRLEAKRAKLISEMEGEVE